MRFFLDTNIPYSSLKIFEEMGLEAVHARDIGLSKSIDAEILEQAVENKSILITKDLEFGNTKIFPKHYGVVIFRLPSFFTALQFTKILKDFLITVSLDELSDSVAIVKLGRYRIRKLD